MSISYEQLLEEQQTHRKAFGDMLRRWRIANDWQAQDPAWLAKERGFLVVPHELWKHLEAGTADELRRETFFALGDLNQQRYIIPLGDWDGETTRWTAVEFWACYCGFRPVPARWSGR